MLQYQTLDLNSDVLNTFDFDLGISNKQKYTIMMNTSLLHDVVLVIAGDNLEAEPVTDRVLNAVAWNGLLMKRNL